MDLEDERRFSALFAMPKPMKITSRSSSITNSFVNGVIPVRIPTPREIRSALEALGMNESVSCSYCGDVHTEWDHLRPLVIDKRPTGFVSEIHNLVPACGKCNQSKGNKPWREWMLSDARLSPKTRGILDLSQRVQRIEDFERWSRPTHVEFEEIVSPELWKVHWENHSSLLEMMREAELVAAQIRAEVALRANVIPTAAHKDRI